MSLIADILLAGGALGVAVYCFVLSRRLTRFTDLERGVGGAVSVLSSQVDELTRALESARAAADGSGEKLQALTGRAEEVSRRLELHVASLHDLEPAPAAPRPVADPAAESPAEADPAEAEAEDDGPAPAASSEPISFSAHAARQPAPRKVAAIAPRSGTVRPVPAPLAEEPPVTAKPAAATPKVPSFFARRPGGDAK